MARLKLTASKQPLRIRTHALTPDADRVLQRLSQEASDRLGWTVSSSAVIRGLLAYVEHQAPAWTLSELDPLIEQEITAGRVWGSKKRT